MADKRYRCDCPGIGVVNCYHPCNMGCCPGGTPAGGKSVVRSSRGRNNTPTYAGRHQNCKFSCRGYDEVSRNCPCHQRPAVCCGAEKPNLNAYRGGSSNPADISSFGFTKNYDGRIRGGVKTREAFFRPKRGYAFDTVSRNF